MPFPSTFTGWRPMPPPPTASRVYYAYSILARGVTGNYKTVGTFQQFSPSSTRQVVRVRGIATYGGYPFELAPGPADTSITVNYLMLYLLPLNEALGYQVGSVTDLNRQRVPFAIMERCRLPVAGEATTPISGGLPSNMVGKQTWEVNLYLDCYLSNVGRTITQGTVTVAETATIQVGYAVDSKHFRYGLEGEQFEEIAPPTLV